VKVLRKLGRSSITVEGAKNEEENIAS